MPLKKRCFESIIGSASAGIAGLGGLGSNLAAHLARLGVGRLLLVDFDTVEPGNLNRQCYTTQHIGRPKTEALKEYLLEINPALEIRTRDIQITRDNAPEIFNGYPIVGEALDKAESKAELINALLEHTPSTRIVSGSGMGGYGSANAILTRRRLSNLYICGDMQTGESAGMLSPRVGLCAAHQANMILRLILNIEEV